MPAQAVLILLLKIAHSWITELILRLCSQPTSMQQRLRYTRRWASLLLWLSGTIIPVSLVAVALNGKAFLITESGAPALDARSNPMIVEPQPLTVGLAELGCTLLAQTSRVYVLTGPSAK